MRRTLVVPAAGQGTRLQSPIAKALTPVAGRPMISHVLSRLRPWCESAVVIVSPASRPAFEAFVSEAPMSVVFAEQAAATGMLDAILLAADAVRRTDPDRVWICWCDQVLLSAATIERMAAQEESSTSPAAVVPTARVASPYIHFDRDEHGRLLGVRQRREGDAMPAEGEADSGLFSLSPTAYFDALPSYGAAQIRGAITHERNFLPFLPWIARDATVKTVPVSDVIETVGINTPEDLVFAESHLRGVRHTQS
jgi:bifunctional UDP-N-acetylglucosamine pyrophosphorylase/glucosamine-1-phosphate N-acetyltransferase